MLSGPGAMASKTDAAKNVKLVSLDSKGVRSQYFSVKLIFYTLIFGPQDHLRAAEKSDRFLGVFRLYFGIPHLSGAALV